jgi:hypothetical protein
MSRSASEVAGGKLRSETVSAMANAVPTAAAGEEMYTANVTEAASCPAESDAKNLTETGPKAFASTLNGRDAVRFGLERWSCRTSTPDLVRGGGVLTIKRMYETIELIP